MSRYDVAFLACRILAVALFVLGFVSLANLVDAMYEYLVFDSTFGTLGVGGWFLSSEVIYPGSMMVISILLWLASPMLANRLIPSDPRADEAIVLDARVLLSVAVFIAGVLVFCDAIMNTMELVFYRPTRYYNYGSAQLPPAFVLGGMGIHYGVGLLIMLMARRIGRWFYRHHESDTNGASNASSSAQ